MHNPYLEQYSVDGNGNKLKKYYDNAVFHQYAQNTVYKSQNLRDIYYLLSRTHVDKIDENVFFHIFYYEQVFDYFTKLFSPNNLQVCDIIVMDYEFAQYWFRLRSNSKLLLSMYEIFISCQKSNRSS